MEVTVENAKFANQILGTDIYPFEILRIISPTELEIRENLCQLLWTKYVGTKMALF